MRAHRRIVAVALGALALSAGHGYCHDGERVAALAPANTSASREFKGSSNGLLAGTSSISKVDVHTLLYPGSTTQVLAHYLPWWGPDPRGLNVGYRSDDPRQAFRTFADMRSRGIDGVIVDWYGQGNFVDTAWRASMPELAKFPGMTFSIMIDSGSFKFNACRGCDVTATILNNLAYISREYFTSDQYLRYEGHPVVSEFGMDTLEPADWARIHAAYPDIYWLHTLVQGFDFPYSKGAYVWTQPVSRTMPQAAGTRFDLQYRERFYNVARNQPPGTITVGGVWSAFDDTKAPWGAAAPRFLAPSCGRTWLETFKSINERYSARQQLPFVQLITWNDYEEGSALETGIASCTAIDAQPVGASVAVRITHQETVDHLELYEQLGAASFRLAGRYPANTTSMPLPDGRAGTYFIKAVGKPFIENVVSAAIVVR
ncbi:TPA: hypothetical protein QDC20_005543 [Burkholderia aenigmatica]|uniref:hypothetical protein n=1 Tax=Burkholderia sp. AU45251 TaxID=3059204 RepID=UPI00264F2F94|nr:hypothetical protein [Burkholderia sp. AU45251]HDR9481687.1 hypothetical protein [Burkholderia aenigmatica]MDN7513688.1 hypothetical protein [Burkholderia sp. AU45251]HDR9513214.1 hypothetical protein [Burkholderia aenigmatica]HDR9590058.1 hypothetical protein [Burkholderia aenigmatica]HDR9597937.1 hypothetical protein [Burkholderia aenigmatica]